MFLRGPREEGFREEGSRAESVRAEGVREERTGNVRPMAVRYAIWAVIILVACILLELFMFNYNHWHAPKGPVLTASKYVKSPLSASQAGGGDESASEQAEDTDAAELPAPCRKPSKFSTDPGLSRQSTGLF